MSQKLSKIVIQAKTLQELAVVHGKDQLLDDMVDAGLARVTAIEMYKGTYKKGLRGTTRKALLDVFKPKYGIGPEVLFRSVRARRMRAS